MIKLTIYGAPMGKARARTVRKANGRVHSYTPSKTVAYERKVAKAFVSEVGKANPTNKPCAVSVIAWYKIPKSFSKKNIALALAGELLPCVRPDVDNIAKLICDGLNGLAWVDDKQVIKLTVEKRYGTVARVEVNIDEVNI